MKNLLLVLFAAFLVSCSPNYGEKIDVQGADLYYKDSITLAQAEKIKNYLIEQQFFGDQADSGVGKSIQLAISDSTFAFRFPVKKGIDQDEQYIAQLKLIAGQLTELMGQQVDIHLCDENLETIRTVIPL